MKAEQLRKSILQMAIQGKLVPQNPDDEPASVLLERIRAEKQRLIKEGKIKKDKSDSVIFRGDDNRHYEKIGNNPPVCIEDELPFEIPDSWSWCRLKNFINVVSARRVHQSEWKQTGIPFYRAREIVKLANYGKINNELFISTEHYNRLKVSGVPQKGDLMVTAVGTIGLSYVVQDGDIFYYKDASVLCFENRNGINAYWLKNIMDSCFIETQILEKTSGTTVKTITIEKAQEYLIPLPPLAEQERIVAEIEKYEPLIAEYDKLEQEKSKLDGEIYDKLKKSILQYAIQGKLVPQEPTDEPVSVFLEKIRAEKKAKLGKKYVDSFIYKGDDNCYYEKVGGSAPVLLENLPFEIPDSWCWARLGGYISLLSGRDLGPSQYNENNKGVPYITGASNFKDDRLIINRWTDVPVVISHKGDLLITCKGTIGTMAYNQIGDLHIARQIMAIRSDIDIRYVKIFLQTKITDLQAVAKSMIPGISRDDIEKAIIPIPPIQEQAKIVVAVGNFMRILKDEA